MNTVDLTPAFVYEGERFNVGFYRYFQVPEKITVNLKKGQYLVVFTLQNDFNFLERIYREGSFFSCNPNAKQVDFIPVMQAPATLLTVCLDQKNELLKQGKLTLDAIIPPSIMRIIVEIVQSPGRLVAARQWMNSNVQLLLHQLFLFDKNKNENNYISFRQAESIWKALQELQNNQQAIQTVETVITNSGIKKYIFQKGCRYLYTVTLKEILYESAMQKALALLVADKLSGPEVSRILGYRSHENFITGFKKYFGITPAAMRRSVVRK